MTLSLGHLFHTIIINKGGQVTKSIIVVTICYKLLCHSSRFLISNFLASTDINVFGCTYLFAMLLLIGLTLFLHPGCFCLALCLQGQLSDYHDSILTSTIVIVQLRIRYVRSRVPDHLNSNFIGLLAGLTG